MLTQMLPKSILRLGSFSLRHLGEVVIRHDLSLHNSFRHSPAPIMHPNVHDKVVELKIQYKFSFFYLVPIVLVTWSVNQNLGLLLSGLGALAWLMAESALNLSHSSPIVYFWNTLIHTGFFVLVTLLVAELQKSRREEQRAARIDFVTGAANARYFNEFLHAEIDRIRRYPHPITVVYIDIDNFKLVNDMFGHKIGDEFAILLPSTRQSEARLVVSKVRANLMEAMRRRNWPVTFSMGAVTYMFPPYSAEQLIDMADKLMYEVKNSTKDGIRFGIWKGEQLRRN
ncbi:MAG: GGDEF domain-containing protein [Chloroflexi bacterium]|nr:MAG: GGDEF domain-containing protein [Chloroflexota bacterium]